MMGENGRGVFGSIGETAPGALAWSGNAGVAKSFVTLLIPFIAAFAVVVHAEDAAPSAPTSAGTDPWSFNLTAYAWLTGLTGNYRAGPLSKSVDVNFIDIAEKLSSFPVAFMGRFGIDINPDWFVMADGNLGGFGADHVSFTGLLQGIVGYRMHIGDLPTSVEFGYRALRVTTQPNSHMETNTTLNGPFAGLTAFW